ncbi:MAG TPA: hypothetical protein PKM78_02375 [Anaerolineae bacterium]|nr:hypothetical protein [Anaerolineae bacterium]HNU03392.1 hypothetical protein [Anaerolineae bacterium]
MSHSPFHARIAAGAAFVRRRRGLLLKLLVLAALAALLSLPPQPLVTVGPQQAVTTINPKLGIHTRLTDEVEEWKIKRTLEMVREMGAPWIVEYFPWAYVEPDRPGQGLWEHSDMVIQHASAQGLEVVARLGFAPQWARPKDTTPLYLDEDHYAAFGDYVYEFVKRYRDQVNYIIIWNEPNLSLEWGYRPVDPAGYTEMLKVAYARAKEANPNVQVLGGALAPTLAPAGSQWGMDDLLYLQAMYDAGAAAYFDILAAHAYGGKFAPDEPAAADAINFARTELLREIMVRNGDGEKPIMITEGGWNDHPRWTRAVRPGQRIAYTLRAYQKVQEEWPWAMAAAMWAFRYPAPARTYQDYFTFVTPDFEPKAIYLETQRYAQGDDG